MTTARISRRMALAGYVPVPPTPNRDRPDSLAIPKPEDKPGTMDVNEDRLVKWFGSTAPFEKRALAQIVETADLIEAAGGQWLLVPADARLLHYLSTFESEVADLEPEVDCDIYLGE